MKIFVKLNKFGLVHCNHTINQLFSNMKQHQQQILYQKMQCLRIVNSVKINILYIVLFDKTSSKEPFAAQIFIKTQIHLA